MIWLLFTLLLMPAWTLEQTGDNYNTLTDGITLVQNKNQPSGLPEQLYEGINPSILNSSSALLRRGKRFLEYPKGSRMSWRLNFKNVSLQLFSLIQYAAGFRTNYAFPEPKEQRRMNKLWFFKRDLFQHLEKGLNNHGLNGRACIMKSFCVAMLEVDKQQKSGMIFKLLKLMFSLQSHEKEHMPYLSEENCKELVYEDCPLSFDSISPYTDDV